MSVGLLLSLLAGPGTVHADDGDGIVRFGRSHWMVGGSSSAGPPNDVLHAEGYQTAYYYECNNQLPPTCWLASKLNFWIGLDLGYRRHEFRGRTTVSFGTLPWKSWTGKKHTMRCIQGSNYCGGVRFVPTTHEWSPKRLYRTTRIPTLGHFRFRATACAGPYLACGVGRTVSPPFRCYAANQQCYFDVG